MMASSSFWRRGVSLDQAMVSTIVLTSAYVVYGAHYEGSFPLTKHVPDHEAIASEWRGSGGDGQNRAEEEEKQQSPRDEGRLKLSAAQCRTLERTGYLVVDNFLSPDEVRRAATAARNVQEGHWHQNDGGGVIFTGLRSSSLAYYSTSSYVGGTENVPDSCNNDAGGLCGAEQEPALLHVRRLMRGLAYSVRTSSFRGFAVDDDDDDSHNDDDDDDTATRKEGIGQFTDGQQQRRQRPEQPQSSSSGGDYWGVPETIQLSLYKADHEVANYNAAHRDGSVTNIWQTGILGHLRSQYLRRRYLTGIVYLNDDNDDDDIGDTNNGRRKPWDVSTDGGQLRIYQNDNDDRGPDDDSDDDADANTTASTTMTTTAPTRSRRIVDDIAPQGGRLVLLSSQSILHQVLPSQRDRLACSIWFTR
jgi:hypothetical protein